MIDKGKNNLNRTKIYLIGSFLPFRDKIISALPGYSFSDPRTHPQSCVQKLVAADMSEAENCPAALAVFPRGKRKGVMSFAELGASAAHQNHILVVDETGEDDTLLEHIASKSFGNIESVIEYLRTEPFLSSHTQNEILKKYPPTAEDKPIPVKNIYFCGTIDDKMLQTIDKARKMRPDKNMIVKSDPVNEFHNINDYDLIVVNFPGEIDWDRHACFMMGAAYSHDLPVLLREDKDWRYPPLQALVRRHTPTLEGVLEYVTEVDDMHINREAVNMYYFFERELKRRNTK
ncbi:hypothetical protein JXB28_01280 [Candidatus Woesearchaeota archaeon]|nr:hypothetical protein [Candidatus Woesearchaeota archaeon]